MKKFRQFVNEEAENKNVLSDRLIWILKNIDDEISNNILEFDFSYIYKSVDVKVEKLNEWSDNKIYISITSINGNEYIMKVGKFVILQCVNISNCRMISNNNVEKFIEKFKKSFIEYFIKNEPFQLYKHLDLLTPEQKEKYKEFIVLGDDFEFENKINEEISSKVIRPIEEVMKKYKNIEYNLYEDIKNTNPRWYGIIENILRKKMNYYTILDYALMKFDCLYFVDSSLFLLIDFNKKVFLLMKDIDRKDLTPMEFISQHKTIEDAVESAMMQIQLDDFEIFESKSYYFDDYFNQIEEGEFEEITDDLLDALDSEEWVNDEDRDKFMENVDEDELKYIELKIKKTDRFGIASMDDVINDKFIDFGKELIKKYNYDYLSIIDYKEGNVYIIKK